MIDSGEFLGHLARAEEELRVSSDQDSDADPKPKAMGMSVGTVWLEVIFPSLHIHFGTCSSCPRAISRPCTVLAMQLHDKDASEQAFKEVDANRDGRITWDEWMHELFHEDAQEPLYIDGLPPTHSEASLHLSGVHSPLTYSIVKRLPHSTST